MKRLEKEYVESTKEKLVDIIYWYETGKHTYPHTMLLYYIERHYTKEKLKDGTLSIERFKALKTFYKETKESIQMIRKVNKFDPMCREV